MADKELLEMGAKVIGVGASTGGLIWVIVHFLLKVLPIQKEMQQQLHDQITGEKTYLTTELDKVRNRLDKLDAERLHLKRALDDRDETIRERDAEIRKLMQHIEELVNQRDKFKNLYEVAQGQLEAASR